MNPFNKDKYESPYCKICTSCGEEGCCPYLNCFSHLIENDNCKYGHVHLRDAKFDYRLSKMGYDIINKLENGLFDAELAVKEYHKQWNEIYEDVYKDDNQEVINVIID